MNVLAHSYYIQVCPECGRQAFGQSMCRSVDHINGVRTDEVEVVPASQLRGAVEALYGAARSLELAAAHITDTEANRRALDAAERARSLAGGR